jgi:hypothetical protein
VDQQGAGRAGPGLGQHLGGHRPEREPDGDDRVRQALRGAPPPLDDRVDTELLGVRDAPGQRGEGAPIEQVGGVHDVTVAAQPVGERQAARRQPQRVVEQQHLGHGRGARISARCAGRRSA